MKILLLCDDEWHPGKVPEDGIAFLREKGYTVDCVYDTANFDGAVLADYNAVILCKDDHCTRENLTSWKTPQVQAAFVAYVENGGGLIVSHSGACAGEATQAMDNLAGCKFVWHPNMSRATVAPVKPHPVTDGVKLFSVSDEHYYMEITADDIEVLAASYASAQGVPEKYESEPYFNYPENIQPCVLVRAQGKGRVCVLTPGHIPEVWANVEFQRLLGNALLWVKK